MPSTWDRDREEEEERAASRRHRLLHSRRQHPEIGTLGSDGDCIPARRHSRNPWSRESERPTPAATISAWLAKCNASHGEHCTSDSGSRQGNAKQDVGYITSSPLADRPVPSYLIDVRYSRIIRVRPGYSEATKHMWKYIALSYVWEAPSHRSAYIMLSQATLQQLQATFSFRKLEDKIPRAVRDAMSLAGILNIPYLWVDRFCIVQDDDTTKYHEIKHMASIYANAYLTIVAAAGDALDPLEHRNRRHFRLRRSIYDLDDLRSREELLNGSKWASRAWTFQELLFSRRVAMFLEDRIVWECHCDIWDETDREQNHDIYRGPPRSITYPSFSAGEKCFNRFMGTSTGLQHTPWPDLVEYSNMVADYSCRSLTYESDTVPAFLGVTTVLSKVFLCGFIYGLPELFFDAALLWRPSSKITRKHVEAGNLSSYLPSWSWMGWKFDPVPVDTVLWKAACDYVRGPRHWKRGNNSQVGNISRENKSSNRTTLKQTVVWYPQPPRRRRRMLNEGFEYRDWQDHKDFAAPDEWQRVPGKEGGFRHPSDPTTVFNYPVPIVDQIFDRYRSISNASSSQFSARHLFFSTTRAYFNIRFYCKKSRRGQSDVDALAVGNIYSAEGTWGGHFRSHDMNLGLNSQNHDGHEMLEFIEISEASEHGVSHVFDLDFAESHRDEQGKISYVNVLWIEWVDGTAYRRGLGHIVKCVWDSQTKEKIDVRLG